MSLGTLGVISAVRIAIYVPIVLLALRICLKYDVEERGWLLLLIFSLIRIVGVALLVAADSGQWSPVSTYYCYIGGRTLDASSLSLLLLSTLGLIEIITEGPSGERKHWWHTLLCRVLHVVGIVALVLTIISMSNPREESSSGGVTMVHIGAVLLAVLFIALVAITVLLWASRYRDWPMEYRKQLLVVVSISLPFLAVRTLYSLISTFKSYTHYIGFDPNKPLTKFNIYSFNVAGEWQTYVSMEVVMEYAVVVIYAMAGNVLRLYEDC